MGIPCYVIVSKQSGHYKSLNIRSLYLTLQRTSAQTSHFKRLLTWTMWMLWIFVSGVIVWATSWQNQRNDCAPSEDSDQPVHPPRLMRVFAVRMKKACVLSYPMIAQRSGCPGWSDSSLGAHAIVLVLSLGGSSVFSYGQRHHLLWLCLQNRAFDTSSWSEGAPDWTLQNYPYNWNTFWAFTEMFCASHSMF